MARRKSLDRWIAEAMTSDENEATPIKAIQLVHVIGQSERHVHTVKFAAGKTYEPKNLAGLFQEKAEDQSQDLSGVQSFRLKVFYGSEETEGASITFVVTGQTDWGLATEGPDERGQKQQNMRLTEAIVQGALLKDKIIFGEMTKLVSELNTTLRATLIENREMFTSYKQLALETVEKRYEHEERLETRKAIGKLLGLAPALINGMAGSEILPESTEDSALVSGILDNVNEDEMKTLLQFLGAKSPKLANLLMSRFERELDKRKQNTDQTQRVRQLSIGGNPQSEGVGNDDTDS